MTIVAAVGSLRASSFNIYVDLPDDGDHMLLVHGYSGAYDKVNRKVGQYVRSLDPHPSKPLYGVWSDLVTDAEPAPVPAAATIEQLVKRGFLTELDVPAERLRANEIAQSMHRHAIGAKPAYLFMPTYDCNLRCGYCFQDHMRTNDKFKHLLRMMTPAMVDRIIMTMTGIERRHGFGPDDIPTRDVTFFGGEPFLAQNRPIVEYIMSAMRRSAGARFGAISNATELDAYEDLLGPDDIGVIQITIDGPQQLHDTRRIYADGAGSFERIAKNIDLALERNVRIDLRMNVDLSNVSAVPALARVLHERGWAGNKSFSTYLAPVHATNEQTERKTTLNTHELDEAVSEMREEHPETQVFGLTDDALRRLLRNVMAGGDPLPMMRATYCGAHNGMYLFDAFGDIYACWERTGDKNVRIGWVTEDGRAEFVEDKLKEWRSRNVASNDVCGQCRYSLYCGGGCAVLAESVHGTMFGNYCDAFGKRFRHAVGDTFSDRLIPIDPDENRVMEMRAL